MMCYCTPNIRTPVCQKCAQFLHTQVQQLEAEKASFYLDYRMRCDDQVKKLEAEVERLRVLNRELVGKSNRCVIQNARLDEELAILRSQQAAEPVLKWDGEIRDEDFKTEVLVRHTGGFSLHLVTAVRITHVPTGLSAESDEDRSEHRNRHTAYEKLLVKLRNFNDHESKIKDKQ